MKNCEHFRDLLEEYALGTLDAHESAELETHLKTGCQDCGSALKEARWLVSQIAYLAPEAAPSDMLKGRLMQIVRAEAKAQPRATSVRTAIPAWAWMGVAALLLVTLYSAWQVQQLKKDVRIANERAATLQQQRQDLDAQLQAVNRETIILSDPASVTIPLASKDPQSPQLQAKWHSALGIVVSGQKVAVPAGDRVLQLWLIPKSPDGKPIPSQSLRPTTDGQFVLLVSNPPEVMSQTRALAITEEPAGGSAQPTTTPRWVGGVS